MPQATFNRPLHLFATGLAVATLVLIFAGGLVTSTGSGLSVPDWPNSYGRFMFAFPLSDMVGGIVFEHTHRLIASMVGFLTIMLAVWLQRTEARPWVRRLGWAALVAVILQGFLGGMTVLFLLPAPISVLHGALAQTFFLMVITLAYATSREFITLEPVADEDNDAELTIRRWAMAAVGLIYVQLIIGATMRHTGSGLAFTDFPLAGGAIWPSFSAVALEAVNWSHWQNGLGEVTRAQMIIHFIHRLGALAVTVALAGTAVRLWKTPGTARPLRHMGTVLTVLLILQVALGAATIWSLKQPFLTTLHVANGAALLGATYLLLFRLHRRHSEEFQPDSVPVMASSGVTA